MLSIGSLYIVKTWNREGTTRDNGTRRGIAAITATAPLQGVGLVRTVAEHTAR